MYHKLKYLIVISCMLLMDCSSLPNTQQKYFNINGLKIKVPSECMVADENSTAMTCISDNAAFFIGIKSSDSFQNILLSEHKKEVKNFYYGIFVELNYGENKLNFFKIKNSNIIITGDSKDFMLKFSRDVYNEMAASDPR